MGPPVKIIRALGPRLSSRAVIGREVPLRVLGDALESAAAGVRRWRSCPARPGSARRGSSRRSRPRRASGFVVLHGECVEFGGDELAYAPVVAALRGLPAEWTAEWLDELPAEARGALAAVLPRETPGDGGPARLYELLLDLLGRLAAERAPVLLVLEDVHWADRSTLALLAFLARNLRERADRGRRHLSRRRRAARPSCAGWPPSSRGGGRCCAIELEPLGARGRRAPARGDRRRPVPAALADELHARAGGNPFFVEELFAARDALPATSPRRSWRASSGSTGRARRCSPRPAGTRRTSCSSASRSRPTRCARRSTPACWSPSPTASRSGTG